MDKMKWGGLPMIVRIALSVCLFVLFAEIGQAGVGGKFYVLNCKWDFQGEPYSGEPQYFVRKLITKNQQGKKERTYQLLILPTHRRGRVLMATLSPYGSSAGGYQEYRVTPLRLAKNLGIIGASIANDFRWARLTDQDSDSSYYCANGLR